MAEEPTILREMRVKLRATSKDVRRGVKNGWRWPLGAYALAHARHLHFVLSTRFFPP